MDISAPLATLLAAFVGGLLLLYVQRRNAYRAASSRFRAAVLGELQAIYPLPAQWPKDIDSFLRTAFPKLQAAVAEFRPHLAWFQRRRFDAAWSKFRNAYGRPQDVQVYHHYMDFDDQPDARGTFRANVDLLLSFADAT
jgi:hypothetical protein